MRTVALIFAAGVCFIGSPAGAEEEPGTKTLKVAYAPKDITPSELNVDLMMGIRENGKTVIPFEGFFPGSASARLFPRLKKVVVTYYLKAPADPTGPKPWRSFNSVRDYIIRVLDAAPEGGSINTHVYWAEGMRATVVARLQFDDGTVRPMMLADGYLYFQDLRGRSWWGRYRGGDRSKWVTAEKE